MYNGWKYPDLRTEGHKVEGPMGAGTYIVWFAMLQVLTLRDRTWATRKLCVGE